MPGGSDHSCLAPSVRLAGERTWFSSITRHGEEQYRIEADYLGLTASGSAPYHSQTMRNPFEAEGRWLKCGLHVHTSESDGEEPPPEVVSRYERGGWDVVCITDRLDSN